MTPIHWIVTIWSLGTCIATLIMITHIEDDSQYKKLMDKYSTIYTPKFILILFYIAAFFHSFFWWWITIPKMFVAWIQVRLVMWLAWKMVRLASTDDPKRTEKLARLLKTIKKISSSDGEEEDKGEKEDVV